MNYTINDILGSPQIISAVIDRAKAVENDRPFWRDYLSFREVGADIFATAYGSKSAVRMGSVISPFSEKPIRGREGLVSGTLRVANLGDGFQMDNDRLEELQLMIRRLNENGMDANSVNEVTDHLVGDFREVILAPEKRIDKLLADLMLTGAASITLKDNPNGVQILDIEIPTNKEEAKTTDKGKLYMLFQKLATKYKRYAYQEMVMSNETFAKYFMMSDEFTALFRQKLGSNEASVSGLLTEEMLSALFKTIGLPRVRVMSQYVTTLADEAIPLMEEGKVALIPQGELGKLRYKPTYEASDKVPGKSYTEAEGGLLVSTARTSKGRFMEYECKWVPEIKQARSIVSIDLTKAI